MQIETHVVATIIGVGIQLKTPTNLSELHK